MFNIYNAIANNWEIDLNDVPNESDFNNDDVGGSGFNYSYDDASASGINEDVGGRNNFRVDNFSGNTIGLNVIDDNEMVRQRSRSPLKNTFINFMDIRNNDDDN